jgi:hypothetical protein
MHYTTSTHLHPAQAVGDPAQGCGSDSDGRGTAGTPLAGVGAVSANGSHSCESPLLRASTGRARRIDSEPEDLTPPREPQASSLDPPLGIGTDGLEGVGIPHPIQLRKRCFRIGTWNMQGRTSRRNNVLTQKFSLISSIMGADWFDILILTETHCEEVLPTPGITILAKTGISSAWAGVAIVARSNKGWSCLESWVLIPGYAILAKLLHSQSTETIWVLGVYGDNTDKNTQLVKFYSALYNSLSKLILDLNTDGSWTGCIAAGDWNCVDREADRLPIVGTPPRVRSAFNRVMLLCGGQDAFPWNSPHFQWTHSSQHTYGRSYARLDRIYVPSVGWSCDPPHVIKTEWSDHSIVWANCYITHPLVERASPAPRIKKLSHLPDSFWCTVVADFISISSSPSLAAWMKFKSRALDLYTKTSTAIKAAKDVHWQRTLRGDLLNPDDFLLAMKAWSSRLDVPPAAPAPAHPKSTQWTNACPNTPHTALLTASSPNHRAWRSALSTLVTLPLHGWRFSPPTRSPFSPITYPASKEPNAPFWVVLPPRAAQPYRPGPWVPLSVPRPPTDIAKLYSLRLATRRTALRKRMLAISLSHSSEWFNLSNNRAVDERGSRASVSVQGLWRKGVYWVC